MNRKADPERWKKLLREACLPADDFIKPLGRGAANMLGGDRFYSRAYKMNGGRYLVPIKTMWNEDEDRPAPVRRLGIIQGVTK